MEFKTVILPNNIFPSKQKSRFYVVFEKEVVLYIGSKFEIAFLKCALYISKNKSKYEKPIGFCEIKNTN